MSASPSLSDSWAHLTEMSEEEKYKIVARHMPCDHCSDCQGWRPPIESEDGDSVCACGHTVSEHIDHMEDFDRRLKVGLRISELLQEKGKLDDYDYEDEDIGSLRKQIHYNALSAQSPDSLSEASSPSSLDGDEGYLKRHRESSEERHSKRIKIESHHEYENSEDDGTGKEDEKEVEKKDGYLNHEEVNESHSNRPGRKSNKMYLQSRDSPNMDAVVKEEVTEDGERLLNEDALNANGAVFAKDGVLTEDGKLKILDDMKSEERKESAAMMEERNGDIEIRVVENDGTSESMIFLTGLKNIFQKQLPKMPKEYIARLVYDRNHRSMALIRHPMKVIGGICYRPFESQEFVEIVFCAIASTEQVKGFTTEITLDKRKWVGCIKDYEGGTIMQCTMVPKVKYLQVHGILGIQRKAVFEKMKEFSTSHIVYPGIKIPVNEDGKKYINPVDVPGICESGWTPEMDLLSNRPRHHPHYNQMRHLVSELQRHQHSWPFAEPVNADLVTDYYDVIGEPMDLRTLEQNVENDAYASMDEFVRDAQKIFDNCRVYNAEGTNVAKLGVSLEKYFYSRLRVWTNRND
ncbi:histone acetyltransferase [Apophysomyces ossiformis]|uniref:Histone acetyltransferase n=1 Tax=Apophysomyces ossiformis TaxID=679940 RepID=A0A8H7C0B1_9FUNG|nr:histone acetyltransferase [Apophysomyces ossiformis]